MDLIATVAATILDQLRNPTLAFLLGGLLIAALGSRLTVPDAVYRFIVLVLLLKVGLSAGLSVREANPVALIVPGVLAVLVGIAVVLIGSRTLARLKGVSKVDGLATAGLFGAVSASTLAAGMVMLDERQIPYEGFIGAIYPFMDIAALVTAIVLARVSVARRVATVSAGDGTVALGGGGSPARIDGLEGGMLKGILTDTFRSPAISALLLGLAIGLLAQAETVFEGFYEPLFRGFLSILMLVMGMEAWQRLSELRRVAHAYILYGIAGPLLHGALGFGAGMVAHALTGFSAGGRGAAGGDGGVKLRHLGPADAARCAARGQPLGLCRHLDRVGHAGRHPQHPGLDRPGRGADRVVTRTVRRLSGRECRRAAPCRPSCR